MNKSKLIWGIVCLVIAGALVVANLVLPPEDLMFQVGDVNMPWVPPIVLAIVGIVLLATVNQPEEKKERRRKSMLIQKKKVFFRLPFRPLSEEKRARVFVQQVLELVGLLTKKNELVSNLSYGDQKLVALARALATDPEIILLDEPSAGLNSQETSDLNRVLKRIVEHGKTICFIEHDMNMVMEISDMITVLNFGVKIAEGPPSTIKGNLKVIEEYLGTEE